MKPVVMMGLCLLFSASVQADAPPSFQPFEVKSSNERFLAEIRPDDADAASREGSWTLRVYDLRAEKKELWSCPYLYRGYPGGQLTDDGKAFLYVEFWFYADHPVIQVYREGKEIAAISGKDLHISPDSREKTVSHELWLKSGSDGQVKIRNEAKENESPRYRAYIPCRDGKTRMVDLQSGELTLP